jgi:hypothetical protein
MRLRRHYFHGHGLGCKTPLVLANLGKADYPTSGFQYPDLPGRIHIQTLVADKHAPPHRGAFSEFRFWRQVEPANGRGTWLLVSYEAVAFAVIHTTIPLEALLEQHRIC